METPTPSPTSEPAPWEPPDWLLPEAFKVGADWWAKIEQAKAWPETFIDAFTHGYVAGYQRGQRRRKVNGSEDTAERVRTELPSGE